MCTTAIPAALAFASDLRHFPVVKAYMRIMIKEAKDILSCAGGQRLPKITVETYARQNIVDVYLESFRHAAPAPSDFINIPDTKGRNLC